MGLLIVFVGLGYITLQHQYIGLILIGVGRFADVIDGMVAERTKTKSHLGEAVDATADKVGLFMSLLVLAVQHMLPLVFVVLMGLQAAGMAILGLTARMRHTELHPFREGKIATAVFWVALLVFVAATMFHEHHKWHIAGIMDGSGYVLMSIALVLGVYTLIMSIAITQ
jgi:phosphatidylglycerophosphate synthase